MLKRSKTVKFNDLYDNNCQPRKKLNINNPHILITETMKEFILNKQQYKCSNSVKDYPCLLWAFKNGDFDEAGYIVDHKDEYCLSFNNSIDNIEALCPQCYSVKTNRFIKNNKMFMTSELDQGCALMEIEE